MAPLPGGHFPVSDRPSPHHFLRLAFFPRASRSAVRFFAAASDAFLARALRWAGVMVSKLRLPPRDPISAIT